MTVKSNQWPHPIINKFCFLYTTVSRHFFIKNQLQICGPCSFSHGKIHFLLHGCPHYTRWHRVFLLHANCTLLPL